MRFPLHKPYIQAYIGEYLHFRSLICLVNIEYFLIFQIPGEDRYSNPQNTCWKIDLTRVSNYLLTRYLDYFGRLGMKVTLMYGIFTIIYLHLPHKSTIHVGYHLWTPKPSKMKVTPFWFVSLLSPPSSAPNSQDEMSGQEMSGNGKIWWRPFLALYRVYIGDEILPSYVGTIVNYYKDPYG